MNLLRNNRQRTEVAKGKLNVPTQKATFSHVSKIKLCTIQDCYVITTEDQLSLLTVQASQSAQV